MSRLFNVSNRVVVPRPGQNVAGGLDNTLLSCKGFDTIVRLGYSGNAVDGDRYNFEDPSQHITTSSRVLPDGRSVVYHLLDLPRDHYNAFYGSMANEKMWHAFHDRPDLVVNDSESIRLYHETSELYARATKAMIQDSDDEVDHDYHNISYAVAARRLGVQRPLTLVMHIPIPEEGILASPSFDQHTRGFFHDIFHKDIFAFDSISLQAPRDLVNLESITGTQNPFAIEPYETKRIRNSDGQSLIAGVFPATGDSEFNRYKLQESLTKKSIKDFWYLATDGRVVDGIKREGTQLIVGADRIDPSKALDKRLRSIQQLVAAGMIDPHTVSYMQAAAESRQTLNGYPEAIAAYSREYTTLRDKFEFHVYSPNQDGVFTPVDQASIFVGYHMADVGLFVSDKDGMHLGPKEFTDVADPANPGACVLTDTIGAAHEFRNCAVIVKPTEEGIAKGIVTALKMPLSQRIEQNEMRREIMGQNDNQRWINSIVNSTKRINPTYS